MKYRTEVFRPLKLKSSFDSCSSGRGKANAGGIRQAHELAGLVETFARRVVNRPAQHAMVQLRSHQHEQRVPATDDERDIRLKRGEVGGKIQLPSPLGGERD